MNSIIPWTGRAATALILAFAGSVYADPTPTPTPSAAAFAKPQPTPTPQPVERHLAPAGVYYLTGDTTVPLKYGIKGLPAGTEVRKVKDNGDTLQVVEDETEFTVKKTQVTNDLDVAAAIQKHTANIDSANEQTRQQREAVLVKQQQEEVEFLRTHPLVAPTPTPTPRSPR